MGEVTGMVKSGGGGGKVKNAVFVEGEFGRSNAHLKHHALLVIRLHLLIERLLDETLLGQFLTRGVIDNVSHLVVVISQGLLFTDQRLQMVCTVL